MFYFFSKSNKTQQGFTIFEMLVAIAIVALFGVITFSGYQSSAPYRNVEAAAEQFETSLREVQVMATAAKAFPVNADSSDLDRFDRGFGIYIEVNGDHYIVYGGNGTGKNNQFGDSRYLPANQYKTEQLPRGVYVKDFCVGYTVVEVESECNASLDDGDFVTIAASQIHVHFRRPKLSAFITDDEGNNIPVVKVIFSDIHDEYERSVIIKKSGEFNVTL